MKLLEKKIIVYPSKDYDYKKFIHDTSICTSTMIVRKEILKGVEFTNSKIVRITILNVKFYSLIMLTV